MGEFAIRNSDGARVKIGTCEDMYYLRFEDRDKVGALPNNVDIGKDSIAAECRFRLPFPDEDAVLPGEYEHYNRGLRLYRKELNGHSDFTELPADSKPGMIQLHHECGLLLNVPCYHGVKLPEVGDCKAFWNGKGWFLELSSLRAAKTEHGLRVFPVINCRHCGEAWRYDWQTVWDYIPYEMQARLSVYRKQLELDQKGEVVQ